MEKHSWSAPFSGYEMQTIDVGLSRHDENKKSIVRSIRRIFNRFTLPNSATSLLVVTATIITLQSIQTWI